VSAGDTVATHLDATGSSAPGSAAGGSGVAAGSGSSPVAAASPVSDQVLASSRPRTRAQAGIHKPKQYTDGTIRYGMITTTEPTSISDALADNNWKKQWILSMRNL
jgi:hypothetical protein